MKWKEVDKNYKFSDGSIVTQKHTHHKYDCYEIEYDNKKIVLSKDHILQINISNLPIEAQKEIKALCTGKIPIKEDVNISIIGTASEKDKQKIKKWILGEEVDVKVKDLSCKDFECYLFNFPDTPEGIEAYIVRIPLEYENQKIDDQNYWIPVEGLAYLYGKYGELEI